MFNSPTRPGFSKLPRPMSNLYKEKMSAPNNAYYVLTQPHAGLPNSSLFSTNFNASDLANLTGKSHTDLDDIGTNTHGDIDTHIADGTIHFADLSGFSTTDLSEGTNLYYTDARVGDYGNAAYLKLDGSNANSNIDIGIYDFAATDISANGVLTSDDLTGKYTAESLGDELIDDTTMETSWVGFRWTFDSNGATHEDGTAGNDLEEIAPFPVTAGKTYRCQLIIDVLTNEIEVTLGGDDETFNSIGLKNFDMVAVNTNTLVLNGPELIVLRKMSVKEVIPPSVTDIEIGNAVVGVTSDTYINKDGGNVRLGGAVNYTNFKNGGFQTMLGTARVERHLLIDPKRFQMPAANYPGESFEGIFYTLDFDDTTEESAYCLEHIPYRWDNTEDIEVEVDWMHTGADAGTVVWGLEYKSITTGETFTPPTTTITQTTAAASTANVLIRTAFTTKILHGNLANHDICSFRFYRKAADGSDTLAEDARVINVCFHYIENKLGQPT